MSSAQARWGLIERLGVEEGEVTDGGLVDALALVQVLGYEVVELAGGMKLFQGLVDSVCRLLIILLQTRAVVLIGEGLAVLLQLDDLELARILGGVAVKNRRVGSHGVDVALAQCLHTGGVGVVLLQLHTGQSFLHLLCRGGAGDRAQDLAVEALEPGDLLVISLGKKRLVGDEVRTSEIDLFRAGSVDGVRCGDEVNLAVLDQSFTLRGRSLAPLDLRLLPPLILGNVVDHVGGNVNVETGHRTIALAQAQTRLVELGA